jgi:curved DNA-binding protein CbpA
LLVMTGAGQVDYYVVLGVPRDASAPDIRRAYRRVARRHHPDLNRDPRGPERFAAAAGAYEVLSDPAARGCYDERFLPRPVAIRRSPPPSPWRPSPPPGGRRGVLELTALEAAHVARFPLTLTDGFRRIVVPPGTRDGDELLLREGGRLIVLQVRLTGKT